MLGFRWFRWFRCFKWCVRRVSRQRYLNIDPGVRGFRCFRWFGCFKWCIRHVYLDSGTSTSIGGCGGSGESGGSGISSGAFDMCSSTAVPQHRSGGAGVPVGQVVQVFQVVHWYLSSVALSGISFGYLSSVSLIVISYRYLSPVSLIGISHRYLSSISLCGISLSGISHW